jgi:hypothetical protein
MILKYIWFEFGLTPSGFQIILEILWVEFRLVPWLQIYSVFLGVEFGFMLQDTEPF